MQNTLPFGEILEAADKLPVHDQEVLIDILSKRIIDRRREELYGEIKEAQKEYETGQGKTGEPDEIIETIGTHEEVY
jgi:hypothetical protein